MTNLLLHLDRNRGRATASRQPALVASLPEPVPVSAHSGVGQAQKRDYRGRFLKKLRHTAPNSPEWLIWSKYWRAWHRRGERGGANGYTDDIAFAGLFERATAAAYNNERDTPFHITEVREQLASALRKKEAALSSVREKVDALELIASVDTHAKRGDEGNTSAPSLMGSAVPATQGDAHD